MKRFYIILILSLFSVNAYALVFDKCTETEDTPFDPTRVEKYQYEFFPAEGKIRLVIIYTDSELKKINSINSKVQFEKIYTEIFDVTFIDENYINAVYIDPDLSDGFKTTKKLIFNLKNGKIDTNIELVHIRGEVSPWRTTLTVYCPIAGSALKSGSSNSKRTFKDILGKYLSK